MTEGIKEKSFSEKADDWMKEHRMLFAIIFAIMLLWGSFYLYSNWDTKFQTKIEYSDGNGYNCTEVWYFKTNLTPLCKLPETMTDGSSEPTFGYNFT